MIEQIDNNVIQRVAETVNQNVRHDATLHTLTITLNGAHGGVDVKAEMTVPYKSGFRVIFSAELSHTWQVR